MRQGRLASDETLPKLTRTNPVTQQVEEITPPSINNYFFVGFGGAMFHGAVSDDDRRVADLKDKITAATRAEIMPGVLAFAFQAPLFRVGGSAGSSIEIEFVGAAQVISLDLHLAALDGLDGCSARTAWPADDRV